MNSISRLANTARLFALYALEGTIPFWPLGRIERVQRYRLRSIVRHAYASVPFYRKAMDERGLSPADFRCTDDLSKLPLIDGMTVQRDIEDFLSTSYDDDARLALYSSGSTSGIRRVVYWDHTSVLDKGAHSARDRVVLRKLAGKTRHHHVHIVPAGSSRYELMPFFQASTFSFPSNVRHHVLSPEEPFETIAERINAIGPQVVSSYSSFAEQFFRFLADRQLNIMLPRVWVYGAEMLAPSARKLIENTFNCPMYSTYQTTETGRLGFQCERRQGFHLNIDMCSVRLVDDDGRTVQPGESGEVVISNLHNRAMVLLNYRLDDWGVMAQDPCSCGRKLPVLDRLLGRSSEMLRLADGRVMPSLTLDALCDEELQLTLQIQIAQPAPGQIQWRIVPWSSADLNTLRRNLLERCGVVLGEDTQVEVEFVDHIPATAAGKFPRVVSQTEESDGPNAMARGNR